MKTKARISVAIISSSFFILNLLSCANQVGFTPEADNITSAVPAPIPPEGNSPVPPLYCTAGQQGQHEVYFPTQCLSNPGLPGNAMGFEMNNLISPSGGPGNHVILQANDPINGTNQSVFVYIEVATYEAPDTIVINAISGNGTETPLLNNCNISTYQNSDPTDGTIRPYSDSILQFNVALPLGTVTLDFDFSGAQTPTYIGVWNLNQFSTALSNPNLNPFGVGSQQFRLQSTPLSLYNDNSDPLVQEPQCPNI